MPNNLNMIEVNQLRVGLYIHLDLGWMDHPFTLSNFKLQDEAQIQTIKKIGLKTLRYDPKRSDVMPLPKNSETAGVKPETPIIIQEPVAEPPAMTHEQIKAQRMKQLMAALDESEKKFVAASESVKHIQRQIMVTPKLCLEEAQNVVNDLVDTALMEGDIAIHALNGNRSSDTDYQHPLNVTVLALMLAKSIDMSKDEARILGLTAILHDIGKAEVSDKVLLKKDPLTHSELTHYQQHTDFGTRMIKDLGLSARFGKIVAQHHEFMDGSGYPLGLKADKIDPLAKVIVLVNSYDNLCNPSNPAQAKTPYEALGAMFAQQRHKFDEDLLKRLIKCLGIYPPGSIVRLSNNKYAKVVSVNPNQPLKPFVLMFHIKNQVEETQLIDLRHETTLNITQCIKPNQTPAEILKFISQRKRVCYFLDSALEAA